MGGGGGCVEYKEQVTLELTLFSAPQSVPAFYQYLPCTALSTSHLLQFDHFPSEVFELCSPKI